MTNSDANNESIGLKKNKPRRNEENEEGFPCFFPTSSCSSSLRGEIFFLEIYSTLEDLTVQNTNEIKGGTKLPPPTTPISAPPPTRK
jgi:hypothetical protein